MVDLSEARDLNAEERVLPDFILAGAERAARASGPGRFRRGGLRLRLRLVEVTLHVILGRMTELEIWDGSDRGGESRGELPDVATLRYREQV